MPNGVSLPIGRKMIKQQGQIYNNEYIVYLFVGVFVVDVVVMLLLLSLLLFFFMPVINRNKL